MAKRRSKLRSVLAVLFGLLLVGAFIGTLVFLYLKSQGEGPVYKTDKPLVTDIVRKAVATGSIVPRREVQIKPRVSGIVRKLHVAPGDVVAEGDLIAEIRIIPDMATLTRAESAVRQADIAVKHAKLEMDRAERMSEGGLISGRELAERRLNFDLRRAELAAAASDLAVARDGAIKKSNDLDNTNVR